MGNEVKTFKVWLTSAQAQGHEGFQTVALHSDFLALQRERDELQRLLSGDLTEEEVLHVLFEDGNAWARALQVRLPKIREVITRIKNERDDEHDRGNEWRNEVNRQLERIRVLELERDQAHNAAIEEAAVRGRIAQLEGDLVDVEIRKLKRPA